MKLFGLSPIFATVDIIATTNFYENKLGFSSKKFLNVNEPHVCLYRDEIEIILIKSEKSKVIPNRVLYGYGYDCYIYAKELERLQQEFVDKEVKIVKKINLTDYNNQEFVIEDIDGRHIAFGLKQK